MSPLYVFQDVTECESLAVWLRKVVLSYSPFCYYRSPARRCEVFEVCLEIDFEVTGDLSSAC